MQRPKFACLISSRSNRDQVTASRSHCLQAGNAESAGVVASRLTAGTSHQISSHSSQIAAIVPHLAHRYRRNNPLSQKEHWLT